MANPPNKTPSILLEAIKFATALDQTIPYNELPKAALDAGWVWYLRQAGVINTENGQFLVDFDVMLGKTDGELQVVDTLTVQIPGNVLPVTSTARYHATQSLIHLFFGRLPPAPEPVMAAKGPVAMMDDDTPREPRSLHEYEDAQREEPEPAIAVVERRTPDGLPVFIDLYSLGRPGPVVANEVLNVIEDTLPSITTLAALGALFTVNGDLMDFMKDLANPTQRQDLKAMLDKRKTEIEDAGNVAPRRRSTAAVN